MTEDQLLAILKSKIGITSDVQDIRLTHLLGAIRQEMEDQLGISVDLSNYIHTDYITDYAHYRFRHPTEPLPPHLKLRRNNLYLKDSRS